MPIADSAGPLLTVRDLHKSYFRASRRFRRRNEIEAVKGVSLELRKGSTLAIVGSSGGGKSTLARSIAGLEKPSGGEAWFDGRKVERAGENRIQLIFQDPGASINPKFTVVRALAEPLSVRPEAEPRTYAQRLEQVGLSSSILGRLTGQLSGGQKARLAVARALAACGRLDEPSMLILDESLSSLDLSVQAQIVNLLVDLQAQYGLTYIFIAHDLSLAGHMADEIAVMYQGKIVEQGTPREVFGAPRHVHTKFLVSSALALAATSPNCDA